MFGKRRKLKKSAREFKTIVLGLMNGIHKLDAFLQNAKVDHDCRYQTCTFILRSIQDITSCCTLYKENIFFHGYMFAMVSESTALMNKIGVQLEEYGRELNTLYRKFMELNKMKETMSEEDLPEDFEETMMEIYHQVNQSIDNIYNMYTYIQSALMHLRMAVSRDSMLILAGVDIIKDYQIHEKVISREMDAIVSFDRYSIHKLKAEKIKE